MGPAAAHSSPCAPARTVQGAGAGSLPPSLLSSATPGAQQRGWRTWKRKGCVGRAPPRPSRPGRPAQAGAARRSRCSRGCARLQEPRGGRGPGLRRAGPEPRRGVRARRRGRGMRSAEPALRVTGCGCDVRLVDTDGCAKGRTDRCWGGSRGARRPSRGGRGGGRAVARSPGLRPRPRGEGAAGTGLGEGGEEGQPKPRHSPPPERAAPGGSGAPRGRPRRGGERGWRGPTWRGARPPPGQRPRGPRPAPGGRGRRLPTHRFLVRKKRFTPRGRVSGAWRGASGRCRVTSDSPESRALTLPSPRSRANGFGSHDFIQASFWSPQAATELTAF